MLAGARGSPGEAQGKPRQTRRYQEGYTMRLGITLPLTDIQGDPATVRDFAQAAEGLGYHHLGAPDHVLGVNVARLAPVSTRVTTSAIVSAIVPKALN